jgi:hypothetical protein
MPSWGAVAYGVAVTIAVAAAGLRLALRERRPGALVAGGVAAGAGPLLWDLILRHTGGRFFTDAPGLVFPVSYEDAGSGVFATALAVVVLGLGPLRDAIGRRVALAAMTCGIAALLVDIYLY